MEGKRLTRSKNAFIAGVCAGLAEYLGISARAMRFMWVIFAILTWLGLAFALYVVLAFVMLPPDGVPSGDRFWHHIEGRNVMILFASALICIGVYIIVQSILGWNLWKYAFPIMLIVAGALVFGFAFSGNRNRQ